MTTENAYGVLGANPSMENGKSDLTDECGTSAHTATTTSTETSASVSTLEPKSWASVKTSRKVGFYFKVALSVFLLIVLYAASLSEVLSINHNLVTGDLTNITYNSSYTYSGVDQIAIGWVDLSIFLVAISVISCTIADILEYQNKAPHALITFTHFSMVFSGICMILALYTPLFANLANPVQGNSSTTMNSALYLIAFVLTIIGFIGIYKKASSRSYMAQSSIMLAMLTILPYLALTSGVILIMIVVVIASIFFAPLAFRSIRI